MPGAVENTPEPVECANCGETHALLRCSRCHLAYFCSSKCQKAYWPFHKTACNRNEFADSVEDVEPKFASWMRSHGKLAVLKDDEIERLERANAACAGLDRAEVMDSMYNRLDPKPKAPSYSAEELTAMKLAADQHQTQVVVKLTPSTLLVSLAGRIILSGKLFQAIKQEDSMWLLEDGVLHLTMLKRNRRGNYANNCTNADTFWQAVMQNTPRQETLQLAFPPATYYHLPLASCDNTMQPQLTA